jgi:hypothetical protein
MTTPGLRRALCLPIDFPSTVANSDHAFLTNVQESCSVLRVRVPLKPVLAEDFSDSASAGTARAIVVLPPGIRGSGGEDNGRVQKDSISDGLFCERR